jgi:hypothetical protein
MAAIDFIMNGGVASIHGDKPDSFTSVPNQFLSKFGESVKRLARSIRTPISKLSIFQSGSLYVVMDNLSYHFIFADNGGDNEIHYYDRSPSGSLAIAELADEVIRDIGEVHYAFSVMIGNVIAPDEVYLKQYASAYLQAEDKVIPVKVETDSNKPTLFISYSHDDEKHKAWVLKLATRLHKNWLNVIFDQWDLSLGSDLPIFMEKGLSGSNRVLCICSDNYVIKANNGLGGVGYEKMIITTELLKNINTNWVIPLIYNNTLSDKVPLCLGSKVYIDFTDSNLYDTKYEELIRDIHGEKIRPIPSDGTYPFKPKNAYGVQLFVPSTEKYHSPLFSDEVTFDYSNNDGKYTIGQGIYTFETRWTRCAVSQIYALSDGSNIDSVAHAQGIKEIHDIKDASAYDTTSRLRVIPAGHIAIFRNNNGYYAAVKVTKVILEDYQTTHAELRFNYIIQTNGSDDFNNLN